MLKKWLRENYPSSGSNKEYVKTMMESSGIKVPKNINSIIQEMIEHLEATGELYRGPVE
jgi:uncharacterized protein YneF (UPF0154 family)